MHHISQYRVKIFPPPKVKSVIVPDSGHRSRLMSADVLYSPEVEVARTVAVPFNGLNKFYPHGVSKVDGKQWPKRNINIAFIDTRTGDIEQGICIKAFFIST